MASVLSSNRASALSIPEHLWLEILSFLPVKDRCVAGRVCRTWRRIVQDNKLWRHVDLRPYKINLHKMWKVIRAHFSDCLRSLAIRGYLDPSSGNWKKHSLSDTMLKELQERCPNLHTFMLVHSNLTNITLNCLPAKIHTLSITHSLVPPGWFSSLKNSSLLPSLNHLDLSHSSKTSDSDLKDIASRSDIQELRLNGCYRVTEEGLSCVATKLTKLRVLEASETGFTDIVVHHLSRNLTNLHRLSLSKCQKLTDGSLATIAACLKKIEYLNVTQCKLLTQQGVDQCKHVKQLVSDFSG